MYINKNNRYEDPSEIEEFVTQNGFAILVSQVDGRPWASHIPLMLRHNAEEQPILSGHVSKANGQWKSIEGQEILAIFSGPHTYISSSWYDHENLPTWNYTAVHAYGRVRLVTGDELAQAISRLTDHYEQQSEKPVSVAGMSPGYFDSQVRGLVGFEIAVTQFQAVRKLSQNRDDVNHARIVDELEKRGDAQSVAIAEEMKTRK
ncbi:MAG: FMN-binding negative transcriptional regulator [Rudanella sp.]|nr:FMN-binding negative transcriptional regulator [Rudanella sp.]